MQVLAIFIKNNNMPYVLFQEYTKDLLKNKNYT
jgi:hypothetical protein